MLVTVTLELTGHELLIVVRFPVTPATGPDLEASRTCLASRVQQRVAD
jgi:hypothetical protein